MLLEKLIATPREGFDYCDSSVFLRDYSKLSERYGDLDSEFHPGINSKCKLPMLKVNSSDAKRFSTSNLNYGLDGKTILIPVHPSEKVLLHDNPPSQYEDATILSTGRTFRTDQNFDIKIGFHGRISSTNRDLSFQKSIQTIKLSKLLLNYANPSIGFCDEFETRAIFLGSREIVSKFRYLPFPEDGFVIPAASLYAKDINNLAEPTLLEQIGKYKNQTAEDFSLKEIIPFHIKSWFRAIDLTGLAFDSHGQNVLYQFDNNLNLTRFLIRDLSGNIRIKDVDSKIAECTFQTKESITNNSQALAYIYDSYLAHLFFDEIRQSIDTSEEFKSSFRKKVIAIFNDLVPKNLSFHEKGIYVKGQCAQRRQVEADFFRVYR